MSSPWGTNNPGIGGLDELTAAEESIVAAILPLGSSGQLLAVDGAGTSVEWVTAAGTGDMLASTYDPATIAEQLVGLTATQTLTNKTLTSPVLTTPQINDTSADHQYIFGVSELTLDRTVTLPLLTANDTFVFEAHAQTLTNKTINTASNTITVAEADISDLGTTVVLDSDIGTTVQAYDADLDTWAGITPGTGVGTALAVNVGTAGAFVVNGGALGTPSSGTVTNLTGTASININGTVGATTPAAGTFTTLQANTSATVATSDTSTTPKLAVTQGSTGDAAMKFSLGATRGYAVGIDNSASDAFVISTAASASPVLGTSNLLSLSSAGALTLTGALSVGTSNSITGGTIELGNASDTTLSRASAGQLAVEGVQVSTASNTLTLSNKTLTAPKFADLGFIADANGNELLIMDTVTSAVNEMTLANAATGNAPTLSSTGGDTNIDIKLTPKGTGVVHVDKELKVDETAYFTSEIDNGNSGTTDTIDWTAGNKQKSTLTGNVTFTFSPEPNGPCNLLLKLVQDATGSRTVTWPADVNWAGGTAPTLTTTASATDIITFYYDGTDFYGAVGGLNFS